MKKKTIHLVLQGKGGVGKSLTASMIAQYIKDAGRQPVCVDTDPVNSTLSGYKELDVKRINLMDGDEINTRRFDELVEIIAASQTDVVVDNGAATFVPLSHYLISNGVPALLAAMEYELVIHTVVTGGQAIMDTLQGFKSLAQQFPEPTKFVVWLNPYWGQIEHSGKTFQEMKAYTENKGRVAAIIEMPALKEDTFGKDFAELLSRKELFSNALESADLPIMQRQRLKIIKDQLYQAMKTVAVFA